MASPPPTAEPPHHDGTHDKNMLERGVIDTTLYNVGETVRGGELGK